MDLMLTHLNISELKKIKEIDRQHLLSFTTNKLLVH